MRRPTEGELGWISGGTQTVGPYGPFHEGLSSAETSNAQYVAQYDSYWQAYSDYGYAFYNNNTYLYYLYNYYLSCYDPQDAWSIALWYVGGYNYPPHNFWDYYNSCYAANFTAALLAEVEHHTIYVDGTSLQSATATPNSAFASSVTDFSATGSGYGASGVNLLGYLSLFQEFADVVAYIQSKGIPVSLIQDPGETNITANGAIGGVAVPVLTSGVLTSVNLFYDPDSNVTATDGTHTVVTSPAMVLAHELYHAYQDVRITFDPSDPAAVTPGSAVGEAQAQAFASRVAAYLTAHGYNESQDIHVLYGINSISNSVTGHANASAAAQTGSVGSAYQVSRTALAGLAASGAAGYYGEVTVYVEIDDGVLLV